jgi:hypothetical protein
MSEFNPQPRPRSSKSKSSGPPVALVALGVAGLAAAALYFGFFRGNTDSGTPAPAASAVVQQK